MSNKSMNLFLQTALSSTFVALFDGSNCIDKEYTYLDFKSDNKYVADISNLLTRNLLKPVDISRIYVLGGPGYFTGIRAGLVIAKAFLDSLFMSVGMINSFDYLRTCITYQGDCSIVIASSRKEGYLAQFAGKNKVSEKLIPLVQLTNLLDQGKVFSETSFIQEIYQVEPISALPILAQEFRIVSRSEDIIPHYFRSETDLFQATP